MNRKILSPRTCTAKILSRYASLRRAEQKVADFVLQDPELALSFTARELGEKCGTSEATVVRFCQALGYKGLPEFRTALIQEVLTGQKSLYEEVTREDSAAELIRKVTIRSIEALQDTLLVLDPKEFEKAVQAIVNAGKLYIFGAGGSAHISQEAALKFLRLGFPAVAYGDFFSQVTAAALLGPEDTALGLSYTGATADTVDVLTAAHEGGATTICLTNFDGSPITEVADIKLITGAPPGLLGGEGGPSRITQLVVMDALTAAVVLQRRDVEPQPDN